MNYWLSGTYARDQNIGAGVGFEPPFQWTNMYEEGSICARSDYQQPSFIK